MEEYCKECTRRIRKGHTNHCNICGDVFCECMMITPYKRDYPDLVYCDDCFQNWVDNKNWIIDRSGEIA
jgi:hypothetical protein